MSKNSLFQELSVRECRLQGYKVTDTDFEYDAVLSLYLSSLHDFLDFLYGF